MRKEPKSDMAKLRSLSEEEIERRAREDEDSPPIDEEFWLNAPVPDRSSKESIHIRLDSEVLKFFKQGGPGYQTKINAVLANYVRHQKRKDCAA